MLEDPKLLVNNRDRDFWRETKKLCGNRSGVQSTVDGLSEPVSIANLFARKYEDLYSCVGYNETEMSSLKLDVDNKILHDGYNEHCIIKAADVINAVSRLKSGKNDGHSGLSSDHVKQACQGLYIHVSMLLSAIIVHGCNKRFIS